MNVSSVQDKLVEGLKAFNECRWLDAAHFLNDVFQTNPSNIDICRKLGFALSQSRQLDEAAEIFKHLSTIEPQKAIWPYMIGYQFYVKSEWGQSVEWFDKALNLDPDYIKCLYRKAYSQMRAGKANDSLVTIKHCIETWQRLSEKDQQTDLKYYASANFLLGKYYLSVGLSLKARRPLEIALSYDGNNPDRHYELGKCLFINRNYNQAIDELSKANSLKPGVDYVLDKLAQSFIANGDKTKAEAIYNSIPEKNRRGFVLKNMGDLYLGLGKFEKATPLLKEAVSKDRRSFKACYFLGQSLEGLGQYNSARQAYSKAVDIRKRAYNSDFPEAVARIQTLDTILKNTTHVKELDSEGTIDFYNVDRGFGFIQSNSGEKIFFHISNISQKESICKGAKVTFKCCVSEKGLKATDIHIEDSNIPL